MSGEDGRSEVDAPEGKEQPWCDWPDHCAFPDCGCPAAYGGKIGRSPERSQP